MASIFALEGHADARGTASLVADLVDEALFAQDGDRERARASLGRASALLKAERIGRRAAQRETIQGCALAPWQVRKVAAHIESRLDTALGLDELAQVARLSRSYFSRAFKRSFNTPPHDYIVRRRIERAQVEMLKSCDSLCQVALSCGFADQAHFSRVFRRLVGSPPFEWRRARLVNAEGTRA